MNKAIIDEVSSEFCLIICKILPDFKFNDTRGNNKALKQIDSEPAELLGFIAEVAQLVYSIKPLPKREFPLNMIKSLGTIVQAKLSRYSPDTLPVEERLVLFWLSLVRILAKFKSGYYAYDLTEQQLDDLKAKATHIQHCALGYKVCSEKKVREFIDKLSV